MTAGNFLFTFNQKSFFQGKMKKEENKLTTIIYIPRLLLPPLPSK